MELEFRIFHHVFCEAYMIQRKAIEFDEYVRISYEKYLLGLVTISPTSMLFCCAISNLCDKFCEYRLVNIVLFLAVELY